MNLPNKLTILRMLLVPILVVIAYIPIEGMCGFVPTKNIILLVIFCVASITDFFDGYIARKNNLVTSFGKFLDPIADKILVLSSLLILVDPKFNAIIPAWIVIIMESRELLVAASRMLQAKKGVVVAASMAGKIKTNAQMYAIILAFICNTPFFAFAKGTEGFASVAGVVPEFLTAQFVINVLMSLTMVVAIITSVISGWDYIKASKDEILESK